MMKMKLVLDRSWTFFGLLVGEVGWGCKVGVGRELGEDWEGVGRG